VSEGEGAHLGWVVAHPASEVEGEGGEGFYIARRGSRADLLVIGGELGEGLPISFWWVSLVVLTSRESGEARVSC